MAPFTTSEHQRYIIADCELAAPVIVMCAVQWGKWVTSQFFMMGLGNLNALSWITNGKAKQGTSMRILYFFHRPCIQRNIDIRNFTIRIGSNVTPDFLPRETAAEISLRPKMYGMSQVAKPWFWGELALLRPQWNWGGIRLGLPFKLSAPEMSDMWNNRIVEWAPTDAIPPHLLKRAGINGRMANVKSASLHAAFKKETERSDLFSAIRRRRRKRGLYIDRYYRSRCI